MKKNGTKDIAIEFVTLYPALEITVNSGVSQDDTIRILKKLIIDIGKTETRWDEESNDYYAYLESQDAEDGILLIKNGTREWYRLLR